MDNPTSCGIPDYDPQCHWGINQQTSWGAVILTVDGKTLRLDALAETESSGGPHRGGREEIRPAPSL